MSYCHICRIYYREPPGEEGDHECPACHRLPPERSNCADLSDEEIVRIVWNATAADERGKDE